MIPYTVFEESGFEAHDMSLPVVRRDRVPACVGPCLQGRQACPCPEACQLPARELPASCSQMSINGERVMVWLCCAVLAWLMVIGVWHGLASLFDMLGAVR